MTIIEALAALMQVMNSATSFMANAQQISAIIQKANSEGRTAFTPEEEAIIRAPDDIARAALLAQITAALSK